MKKIIAIVLLVVIIGLIIWALIHFKGFGIPGLNDKNGKGSNDTSISDVVDKNEPTESEKENNEDVFKISVQKNEIIIDNSILDVNELEKAFSGKEKSIQIEIVIDDTAAKNTVDELTDKLDELGYKNYKKTEK